MKHDGTTARRRWVTRQGLILLLGAALTVSACDATRRVTPTGASGSAGIVVESTTLQTVRRSSGSGCDVSGRLRNESGHDQVVILRFTAFDDGDVLGQATTAEAFVAAGGRSTYTARFVRTPHIPAQAFGHCDQIDRLDVAIDARAL